MDTVEPIATNKRQVETLTAHLQASREVVSDALRWHTESMSASHAKQWEAYDSKVCALTAAIYKLKDMHDNLAREIAWRDSQKGEVV